jgi:hypothetical protein
LLNERANEDGAELPLFPVEPSAEGWRRSGRTWYDPVMTLRVYVETTVPSYLTAWPSRDLVRAAHQQVTREWWADRGGFELYSSRIEAFCRAAGYEPPLICTPEELPTGSPDDE